MARNYKSSPRYEDYYGADFKIDQNIIEDVRRRWRDFGPHDISQAAELPSWDIIVKDIYTLLEMVEESPRVFDDGYEDGRQVGYEEGFEDGAESDKE